MSAYPTKQDELESQLTQLRTDRYSWWVSWCSLAEYILPRRYRWLVTPNQAQRGAQLNQYIIDSTGTIAARVCATGMMAGITSPTRRWFKLRLPGSEADEVNPVNIWLAEVEKRMMRVFQESNFYNSIAVMYFDLVVFNTANMIIYEDYENVICCHNPCLGEFYLFNDYKGAPGGMFREFTNTVAQVVDEFGKENCSQAVQDAYARGGGELRKEIKVLHSIQPYKKPGSEFKWVEYFWEYGAPAPRKFLREKYYQEQPFIGPRWETSGNDAYGRGPGMDALGDIKQLQQETKRKAQAIDKLSNPPMVADVELKNKPASTLPGGVTYVTKKDGVGFSPAYQNFRPPIQEIMLDIQAVQERIKNVFFNDLFLMISQLQTVRTATEIDARREEKLVLLGPVLERLQTEALDPIIDRVFGIMFRGGLLGEPPAELSSVNIEIDYVSMLAEAQRAAQTVGMERFMATLANAGAIDPTLFDLPNWDRFMTRYALVLGNDPSDLKTPEELAVVRKQRAEQQARAEALETGTAAVQGAKVMSETNVGGGQNALEMMMGGL